MRFIIKPAEEKHFQAIESIANNVFGEGLLKVKHLKSSKVFAYVLEVDNQVGGYILGRSMEKADLLKFNKELGEKIPDGKVELLNSVAVVKELRNKGLGQKMFTVWYEEARKKADTLAIISWIRNGKAVLKRQARARGFLSTGIVHNYWLEYSLKKAYECIECGTPPCTCSAEVFVK